jgi:uncharacterized lipoprotein YddW (UPF0748 family)
LPRGLFQPENTPEAWEKADTLRISAWRSTVSGPTTLTLYSLKARTDAVAILRATERTAPGETAFAAALADRCARLLTKAGIPFAIINDDALLDPFALLFMPYAPALPPDQLRRLSRFLERNGRLVVFYNASQPLANLMGFRIGAWQGADNGKEWSAFVCNTARLPGAPLRVPHFTANLLPPHAVDAYHAATVALWADDAGHTTDFPACTLSDRGAWFAHTPPLASPSATELLRVLACTLYPALQQPCALAVLRDNESLTAKPPAQGSALLRKLESAVMARTYAEIPPLCRDLRNASAAATLADTPARPKEIRAAWEPRGSSRSTQAWDTLMKTLASRGVNTLFVHWQSAGTAHYPTGGRRTESSRARNRASDPLADACAAGTRHGVAIHAWVTCWTLEGAADSQRTQLMKADRLMRDAAGQTLPWLCPALPENRTLILDGIRDLARHGVSGIHLDYVRYPETQGCYAPATRKAFEAERKAPVRDWPAAVLPGSTGAEEFQRFRCRTITAFVRAAQAAVRAVNPEIQLSAAVFPSPESAALRGQDWPAWIQEGLIAFACPMIYTENDLAFAAALDACLAATPNSEKSLVAGMGTGADESQLDAFGAAAQIRQARTRHLAGFAFFAIDDGLLTQTLPYLGLP